jgi:hypothetical protein
MSEPIQLAIFGLITTKDINDFCRLGFVLHPTIVKPVESDLISYKKLKLLFFAQTIKMG